VMFGQQSRDSLCPPRQRHNQRSYHSAMVLCKFLGRERINRNA